MYRPLPHTTHVARWGWVENLFNLLLTTEVVNLVLIPSFNGFFQLFVCPCEVAALITSNQLCIPTRTDEPSKRVYHRICVQGVGYFNVHSTCRQTGEETPIPLYSGSTFERSETSVLQSIVSPFDTLPSLLSGLHLATIKTLELHNSLGLPNLDETLLLCQRPFQQFLV